MTIYKWKNLLKNEIRKDPLITNSSSIISNFVQKTENKI